MHGQRQVAQPSEAREDAWYVVDDVGRAVLRQRGAEIQVTSEFGRSYKCVVDQRGSYTMEDWLVLTETFSQLLLRHNDILHPMVSSLPLCQTTMYACTCQLAAYAMGRGPSLVQLTRQVIQGSLQSRCRSRLGA